MNATELRQIATAIGAAPLYGLSGVVAGGVVVSLQAVIYILNSHCDEMQVELHSSDMTLTFVPKPVKNQSSQGDVCESETR